MAFAKVSGYVSGVLDQLTEIVIKAVDWLVKFVRDPQQGIKDLGNAIKDNIIARFEGMMQMTGSLGKMMKALFSGDWEALSDGAKEYADALGMVTLGIRNLTDKVADVNEKAMTSASLNAAERQLEREVSAWQKRAAELEKAKAKAQVTMYDTSKSAAERQKALRDYKEAVDAETQAELDFARRRIEIQKARMELTTNADEDYDKLNQLEAAYTQVEARREQQLASLQRRANGITNAADRMNGAADKAAENARQAARAARDASFAEEEARILGMRDGFDKEQRLRELQHQRRLEQIRREREDAIMAARRAAIDEYDATQTSNSTKFANLSAEQQEAILRGNASYQTLVEAAFKKESADKTTATGEYMAQFRAELDEYAGYLQQREQLDREYRQRKQKNDADLQALEARLRDESLTDEERAEAKRQVTYLRDRAKNIEERYRRDAVEADVKRRMEQTARNPEFAQAMQDASRVGTESLRRLLEDLRATRTEFADVGPEALKTVTDLMNRIETELVARDPIAEVAVQGTLAEGLRKEVDALKKAIAAVKDDMVTLGDKTLPLADAQNILTDKSAQLADALAMLDAATDKASQRMQVVFGWIAEIGSALGGKTGQALQGLGSLGQSLMQSKQSFSYSAMQQNGMLRDGATGNAWGDMNAWGKANTVMAAAQAAYQAGTMVADLLGRESKHGEYEKYAKRQAEFNALTQSVYDYQYAVLQAQHADDAWFGNDALGGLRQSWEEAQQSKDQYFAKLYEQQERYRNKDKDDNWSGIIASGIVGAIGGAITGGAFGSALGPWGTVIGSAIGSAIGTAAGIGVNNLVTGYDPTKTSAIDNLRIETRKRKKSFLGIGGHDQQTADLRTWAREQYGADLFDADGWIDTDLAREILETVGGKLQGETAATLEQLIELKEQYDEYKQQLREYVDSLYSPIVDNMVSAMWDWFDTGRDALDAFRDYASQTFRAIMTDLVKTVVMRNIVGTFQDDIAELYERYNAGSIDEETLMKSVAQQTEALADRYEKGIPALQGMMTTMSELLEASGFDVSDPSASASAGTSARTVASQITQDSIDEVTGRMTALQLGQEAMAAQVAVGVEMLTSMTALAVAQGGVLADLQALAAVGNSHLEDIARYTKPLLAMGDKLDTLIDQTKYR